MADIAQLGVAIKSDEAKKGAQEVRGALKDIATEAKATATAVDQVATSAEKIGSSGAKVRPATAAARELTAATTGLSKASEIAADAVDREAAVFADLFRQIKAGKAQVTEIQAASTAASTAMGSAATASSGFVAALAPLGGPIGAGIIAAITVVPMIMDAIRKSTEEAKREAKAYRDELAKLSPAALEAAKATELALQARIRSTPMTAGARADALAASNARLNPILGAIGSEQTQQALAFSKALQENQRELLNTAERIAVFRKEGKLAAEAYGDAAKQWDASGRSAKTLGEALAAGDQDAQRLLTAQKQLATANQTLTTALEGGVKAAREKAKEDEKALRNQEAFAEFVRKGKAALAEQAESERKLATKIAETNALMVERIGKSGADLAATQAQLDALRQGEDAYRKVIAAQQRQAEVEEAAKRIKTGNVMLDNIIITQIGKEIEARQKLKEQLDFLLKQRAALNGWNGKDPLNLGESIDSAKQWQTALEGVTSTLRDLAGVMNGTGSDAVKMLGGITAAVDGLVRAQVRAEQMRKDNQTLSIGQAVAAGVGGLVGAYGAGAAVGSLTTSKTAGALGGAAAGAATGAAAGTIIPGIGNIVGGIIGGVVGGIGGLLSAANQGKQAAAQMQIAQQQLGKSLDALRATFANDSLSAAIAQARAQFDDLRKSTEAAYSGKRNEAERNRVLEELNTLEARRVEILQQQAAVALALATQDLDARTLAAAGRTGEAEALRDQIAAQKEINAAIQQYGADSAYVTKLREVQAAEQAAAETARTLAEAEKARTQAQQANAFGLDVQARRQALNGDDRGAFITRQQIGQNSALAQAEDLYRAGTITAEALADFKRLLGDEFTKSITDFDAAVAKANRQVQEDLSVRELLAQGKDKQAEAVRQQIANQRELDGITDANLRLTIEYVQGLEAEARAKAEAAEVARVIAEQNADIDRRMVDALRDMNPAKAAELQAKITEVERAKEMAAATDESVRARLAELFALQDTAKAHAALTAELEKQAQSAKALADLTTSVEDDYLRSTGRTFEADVNRLKKERDDRLKQATDLQAAQSVIDQINETFNAKYNALIASQLNAAPAAAAANAVNYTLNSGAVSAGRTARDDAGTVLGGDSVTFRGGNSITETSGMRLIDYAASQTALLREIRDALRGERGNTDLLPSLARQLDRQYGRRASDQARMVFGEIA